MVRDAWKIGQEVYYYPRHRGDDVVISTVAKISPSGQITLANGERFAASGYHIPYSQWNPTLLRPMTAEDRNRIAENQAQHQARKALSAALHRLDHVHSQLTRDQRTRLAAAIMAIVGEVDDAKER